MTLFQLITVLYSSQFKNFRNFQVHFLKAEYSKSEEFENLYTKVKEQCDHVTFSIAANKTDLRNDENSQNFISKEKLREIGEKFNSEVIEISAKEDAGIERIFNDVIRKFIKYELEDSKEKKKICQIRCN